MHAHVPRRAVGHGIYCPNEEIAPPCLKPGQKSLYSQGLYTAEVSYKDSSRQEPNLLQDRQNETEYAKVFSKATAPEDYKNTVRARKATTERTGEALECTGGAHWCSEYRQATSQTASRMTTPRMPAQEILASRAEPVGRSCVSRAPDSSCYASDFGKHGSNPRDKVSRTDAKLPVFKSPLTAGTPRGTSHIPGYQGFIPSYPGFNEPLLRAASGDAMRSTDKTNITQIFHKDLVGYAGHVPMDVSNDFGGRKPTNLTVFGHDFQPHKTGALS
eukprot:gb/GFBE01001798.1/.p1 GENE.gb/GFBE01001798.1/~~gb/GFBE01001798.1/.p1  ORF type:complete len:273 (+),score=34.87 gb/GFBE01001798.1/:1-819(+)